MTDAATDPRITLITVSPATESRRLRRRSIRFQKHYAGSLPCIPARHDILCGALDFLWKPWGSIELWEDSIVAI